MNKAPFHFLRTILWQVSHQSTIPCEEMGEVTSMTSQTCLNSGVPSGSWNTRVWKFGLSRVSVKQLLQDPELARMNSSVDATSASALGVGVGGVAAGQGLGLSWLSGPPGMRVWASVLYDITACRRCRTAGGQLAGQGTLVFLTTSIA